MGKKKMRAEEPPFLFFPPSHEASRFLCFSCFFFFVLYFETTGNESVTQTDVLPDELCCEGGLCHYACYLLGNFTIYQWCLIFKIQQA